MDGKSTKRSEAKKKQVAKTTSADPGETPAGLIDARIKELGDWRGKTLAHVRALIKQADSDVVEEVQWRKPSNSMLGVPVWTRDGIICTGEAYKDKVKLTFAKGAALDDPAGLFNAGLEGNARRAIDIREAEKIDERAFKALVRAAAALNAPSARRAPAKPKAKAKPKPAARAKPRPKSQPKSEPRRADATSKLLSGGNPQIAKAHGAAPVRAYIAAMPDWKRDVGRRLDALIVRTVPDVRKAVRWNTPFYGMDGQGWFFAFHCFTKYVKVTFMRGRSLKPIPPVESKDPNARYFHIHEDEQLDEKLLSSWIKQASQLPGERLF